MMASTVLDFLFAAQDATTSALTWVMALMSDYPNLLDKVRLEVQTVLRAAGNNNIAENFQHMKYTQWVVTEILHFKPPVPMVPHLARQDTEINGIKIPKGAMVVPAVHSTVPASSPFGKTPSESKKETDFSTGVPKSVDPDFDQVLVFGAGQHKCPGRKYAHQLLVVFLAVLATEYDFKRQLTPQSKGYAYMPTIFPADNLYTVRILPKSPGV